MTAESGPGPGPKFSARLNGRGERSEAKDCYTAAAWLTGSEQPRGRREPEGQHVEAVEGALPLEPQVRGAFRGHIHVVVGRRNINRATVVAPFEQSAPLALECLHTEGALAQVGVYVPPIPDEPPFACAIDRNPQGEDADQVAARTDPHGAGQHAGCYSSGHEHRLGAGRGVVVYEDGPRGTQRRVPVHPKPTRHDGEGESAHEADLAHRGVPVAASLAQAVPRRGRGLTGISRLRVLPACVLREGRRRARFLAVTGRVPGSAASPAHVGSAGTARSASGSFMACGPGRAPRAVIGALRAYFGCRHRFGF